MPDCRFPRLLNRRATGLPYTTRPIAVRPAQLLGARDVRAGHSEHRETHPYPDVQTGRKGAHTVLGDSSGEKTRLHTRPPSDSVESR
jgi:hypothetical protein